MNYICCTRSILPLMLNVFELNQTHKSALNELTHESSHWLNNMSFWRWCFQVWDSLESNFVNQGGKQHQSKRNGRTVHSSLCSKTQKRKINNDCSKWQLAWLSQMLECYCRAIGLKSKVVCCNVTKPILAETHMNFHHQFRGIFRGPQRKCSVLCDWTIRTLIWQWDWVFHGCLFGWVGRSGQMIFLFGWLLRKHTKMNSNPAPNLSLSTATLFARSKPISGEWKWLIKPSNSKSALM